MTTVVKRGAGRPAANAKRAKHAQRTPLPPKGKVGVAGSGVTAKVIEEQRGRTVSAVRVASFSKRGVFHHLPAGSNAALCGKEGEIFGLNVEPVGCKICLAELAKVFSVEAPAVEEDGNIQTLKGISFPKALDFATVASDAGWTVEHTEDKTTIVVTAKRGTETVSVTWVDGKIVAEAMPLYVNGPRRVKLRNSSAAKKQVTGSAGAVKAEVKVRVESKANDDGPRSDLPWSVDATNEEILALVAGKVIVWRNGFGKEEQKARVLPTANRDQFKISTTASGDRQLHFVVVDGYRGEGENRRPFGGRSASVSLKKIRAVR